MPKLHTNSERRNYIDKFILIFPNHQSETNTASSSIIIDVDTQQNQSEIRRLLPRNTTIPTPRRTLHPAKIIKDKNISHILDFNVE